MRAVTVRTLKAQASALLRWVEQGEPLLVTRRGRPVARLEPVDVEPRQPMRLRGLFRELAPAIDGLDLVQEIRQMRRARTIEIERALEQSADSLPD